MSKKESKTLIRRAYVVTMNSKNEVLQNCDILIDGSYIAAIGHNLPFQKNTQEVIAENCFLIPGLVQTHTHLCQALFRGQADDLPLLDWLYEKIWPMEGAHTPASLAASSRIACLEMQLCGTSTVLDMATSFHTDSLLEAVAESGMRYIGGNCLMDLDDKGTGLTRSSQDGLAETLRLREKYRHHPLIDICLCPRFAVSCSRDLLTNVAQIQSEEGLRVHIHAAENRSEVALVKKMTNQNNIEYLDELGLLNEKTILVHAIHLSEKEKKLIQKKGAKITHCPSSNMKLGSGLAPVQDYLDGGITVGLGSDGAPCNNSMDPFIEMRLAALIQKVLLGTEALPARKALQMATIEGARTLGIEMQTGSLEVGKLADIAIIDRQHPSVATVEDPYSALVYSCTGRDVRDLWINGKCIVSNFQHQILDQKEVIATAKKELSFLLKRLKHNNQHDMKII